jgi:hypothetical protein
MEMWADRLVMELKNAGMVTAVQVGAVISCQEPLIRML